MLQRRTWDHHLLEQAPQSFLAQDVYNECVQPGPSGGGMSQGWPHLSTPLGRARHHGEGGLIYHLLCRARPDRRLPCPGVDGVHTCWAAWWGCRRPSGHLSVPWSRGRNRGTGRNWGLLQVHRWLVWVQREVPWLLMPCSSLWLILIRQLCGFKATPLSWSWVFLSGNSADSACFVLRQRNILNAIHDKIQDWEPADLGFRPNPVGSWASHFPCLSLSLPSVTWGDDSDKKKKASLLELSLWAWKCSKC